MTESAISPRLRGAGSSRPVATVAMGFVAGMLSGMAASGDDPGGLLSLAEIDPVTLADPATRVPLASYADLYNRVVAHLEDEGFGLFVAPVPLGSFEFLCRSVMGSRDLGEALERMGRFLQLVLGQLEVSVAREPYDEEKTSGKNDSSPSDPPHPLSRRGRGERSESLRDLRKKGNARIVIRERQPVGNGTDDPRRVFAFEWLLRVVHGLACWLAGRSLALNDVRFPYAAPPHVADYALIYTEHSYFGGDELVASFNANLLDLPVRRDEAALREFLAGMPGKIAMLYRRDREAVRMVRDMLLAGFPDSPSLEEVAGRLFLSPRTLHRRLQEEGSSFRMIKDALRRDLALACIEKKRLSVGQMAADLGFADTSAFFRAFRKWTGEAPSRYKKHLG